MRAYTDTLGERIAEHVAHIDAAMHLLLTDIREFDQAGGWSFQGFPTCAHWLAWRVGWTLGTAREHVRVANKLVDLPLIDEALRNGEMSYCKVRAMTRVATPANEHMLLEEARYTTGQQIEVICRKYAMVQRHDQESNERDDAERRHLRRRDLPDGMVQIVATLHPEEAAAVWAALERVAKERCRNRAEIASDGCADVKALSGDVPAGTLDESPTLQRSSSYDNESIKAQQFSRVDALMRVAEDVLRGSRSDRSPIELVVTVSADSLRAAPAELEFDATVHAGCCADGTALSPHAMRRLACDAGVVRLVESSDGAPLSVGRKTRTIPGAMKRALLQRDRGCRFPGCTNRLFVEGHHMLHWADGGETKLGNLVSVCSHHHRFVHEYGYTVKLIGKADMEFIDADGRAVVAVPQPAQPAARGWETIRARNADLEISAETPACGWDGGPIDLVACIHELVRADAQT
jgi:hypothetical protein